MSRLAERYKAEVAPTLMREFQYSSQMLAPRLIKITVNMGVGEAVANPQALDHAVTDMTKIVGQKPVITRAKKSIATYKLRQGMAIGCMATLRRQRMWNFL
ncbi:MAG: 50S ribosomal protein L5, partial [Candidatus Lambdaproteobacteria bacterium]|nr:50S ribosomal protein L5 [Candidatus Lambdaproteobacteria bacterium]